MERTTAGHETHPRAIRNVFGGRVTHWINLYLNNYLEIETGGEFLIRGLKPYELNDQGKEQPSSRSVRLRASVASSTRSVPCSDRSRNTTSAPYSHNAAASIDSGLLS
jgi:hypothetical protein